MGEGGREGGSTDPDKVIDALPGIEAPNLTGGVSTLLPNHHITKPVFIGEIRADGMFDVVWKTKGLVPGDAWSDYLPGSKDLDADWVKLKCGNYNTVTKKCGGASNDALSVNWREGSVSPSRFHINLPPGPGDAFEPSLPRRFVIGAQRLLGYGTAYAESLDEALSAFHRRRFQRNHNRH